MTTDISHHASSRMMRVEEVAEMLDVSVRHVWRMRSASQMPQPVHLGNAVRWLRDIIEKWIEAGCPPVASSKNDQRSNQVTP